MCGLRNFEGITRFEAWLVVSRRRRPVIEHIPIQGSRFGFPVQANQRNRYQTCLGRMNTDLSSGLPLELMCRSIEEIFKLPPWHPVDVECVAHPGKRLTNPGLYTHYNLLWPWSNTARCWHFLLNQGEHIQKWVEDARHWFIGVSLWHVDSPAQCVQTNHGKPQRTKRPIPSQKIRVVHVRRKTWPHHEDGALLTRWILEGQNDAEDEC